MERDGDTDRPTAVTDPRLPPGPARGPSEAEWRGVVEALSTRNPRSLETASLLLEAAAAGTLYEPLASVGRVTWAGVQALAAVDELRRTELAWLSLPTPLPSANDGPVGRCEVRAVLDTAHEMLGVALPTASDPAAVLRAQDRVREALDALADDG